MKNLLLICFLALSSYLCAGSVRLHNNSPYKLRAVIRAADGTYLGEMVILPEHFNTWSSNYPSFGPSGRSSPYQMNPSRSQTPYTVHWHCLDGSEYGLNVNVAAGAAVMSETSQGKRFCKVPKKKKGSPYGPKMDDEQLHEQNEADESFDGNSDED